MPKQFESFQNILNFNKDNAGILDFLPMSNKFFNHYNRALETA